MLNLFHCSSVDLQSLWIRFVLNSSNKLAPIQLILYDTAWYLSVKVVVAFSMSSEGNDTECYSFPAKKVKHSNQFQSALMEQILSNLGQVKNECSLQS